MRIKGKYCPYCGNPDFEPKGKDNGNAYFKCLACKRYVDKDELRGGKSEKVTDS